MSVRRSSHVQDPLEATDLEAEIDGRLQHADDGDPASFAAWLAAEIIDLPGGPRAELPDLESGALLEDIEAAAVAASPVAPCVEANILQQMATPDDLPQAARDLSPAVTHRCVLSLLCLHYEVTMRLLRV